ncbi:hypothetical protein F2Q70_00024480, partial [Brassica cretica]
QTESGGSSTESSSLSGGLMFGQRIYFEDAGGGTGFSSSGGSNRRVRGSGSGPSGQIPRCQVEGCGMDLTNAKGYYTRHRVCGMHSKTPKVIVAGIEQRFCQQCSRFHQLPEFDLEKRSCRRRLAGHNERRRKPQPASLSVLSSRYGRITPSLYGYGYVGEEEEEEESPSHPNGLRRHSGLSSRPPSSLGMFSQIPEIDSESVQFSHWNDPSSFIDNLSSLKRETEDDGKLFHGAQIMSHRLSLPKSSSTASDVVSVDKYLQLQDSVPCKIRAKRGCATHPRSIAERVRRTKISERMRKLQELVPNMDKQTNTSDMLDLAVDYIKDLQRQYKVT